MNTYKVRCMNTCNVEVEAEDEAEAKRIVEQEIADNYDYPWENCEDYDGWSLEVEDA